MGIGRTSVVEVDPAVDPRWDRFVSGHPRAKVYHLGGWRQILSEAYRCHPHYLALIGDREEFEAVLPLMYRRGALNGRRLNSLPLVRQAGPLGRTRKTEISLLRRAVELSREMRARMVVRSTESGYENGVEGLVIHPDKPSWVLALPPDPEQLLERLPKSLRADVIKSRGLDVREGRELSDLRRFYRLYLRTMKMHGAVPRTWRQMELSFRLLAPSGHLRLLLAEEGGNLAGAAIFHRMGETLEARYMASDARYRDHRPAHALYWEAIRLATEDGCTALDFGGGTGSLAWFKRRWGSEPVPLQRYVYEPMERRAPAARAVGVEDGTQQPDRRPTAGLWRHVPTLVTPLAGRLIYRYL